MSLILEAGILPRELVRLDAKVADKADAIAQLAALLVADGCVKPGFAASMERREAASNTYLGKGIAIPHGMAEDRDLILRDGIAVLQVRGGVEWNAGQRANLVVAIAARSDAHIGILRRLTRLMQQDGAIDELVTSTDPNRIIAALTDTPYMPPAASAPWPADAQIEIVLDYPNGLHARPATLWVETA